MRTLTPIPYLVLTHAERRLLEQLALEAMRVVFHDSDRCAACGLGPVGALRDSIKQAFGDEPARLLWGRDANVDLPEWEKRLRAAAVALVLEQRR